MKILFLTLSDFKSINERNIYTDLLRVFAKNGHFVYVISPIERKHMQKTKYIEGTNVSILKLQIGNIQKNNIIEKGISTIILESKLITGIKRYFSDITFDLIMYSTPPITFQKAVKYVKKRDHAKTYLLLKDIFPQNAVDLDLLSKTGIKSILYNYFRNKEKKLYSLSDYIGCMSQANVDYMIKHNSEINPEIVEVCPNSIEIIDKSIDEKSKVAIREKYGIPLDKKVFIYGGNLGKPQGIDFLINCIHSQSKNHDVFFLIVGNGTEFYKLENFVEKYPQRNMRLMSRLPKVDYESLVAACDIGMIFLDHRFTIPNFPCRLLSYMQAKIPVLACTDPNTDVGQVIADGGFGWWCESNNVEAFSETIKNILKENSNEKIREQEYQYLLDNYSVDKCYEIIMRKFIV